MRLVLAALAALSLAGAAAASPVTGPALGKALVAGEVDPASFDFGALRYAPGQTMGFLGAQSVAGLAAAKAHDKLTWQAVIDSGVCPTFAERMTMAGFDSALIAPDAATWTGQKAAAEAAYVRYAKARDTILAGQPSPYPEFNTDEADIAAAARASLPEAQALFHHAVEDQLWRHAIVFGTPKAYAEGVGKAGAVWLNARLTQDGCTIDAANAAWLKTILANIPWFDIPTYGKNADKAAWLIAQHADSDPDLQLLVLQRIGDMAVKRQSDPGDFANLWDRVALRSGRPQRYGTQMRCIGKTWQPVSPLEEPAKLDERRRWVGLVPELQYEHAGAHLCGG